MDSIAERRSDAKRKRIVRGIYRILHVESGRFYVGSTVNYAARRHGHRRDLRAGTHHNRRLQRDWQAYGEDAFVFELLETVGNADELGLREQQYLNELRPWYNCSARCGRGQSNAEPGTRSRPNKTRDEQITQEYLGGTSVRVLAERYELSLGRVDQIIWVANVDRTQATRRRRKEASIRAHVKVYSDPVVQDWMEEQLRRRKPRSFVEQCRADDGYTRLKAARENPHA